MAARGVLDGHLTLHLVLVDLCHQGDVVDGAGNHLATTRKHLPGQLHRRGDITFMLLDQRKKDQIAQGMTGYVTVIEPVSEQGGQVHALPLLVAAPRQGLQSHAHVTESQNPVCLT
jgi:hypothetical protein